MNLRKALTAAVSCLLVISCAQSAKPMERLLLRSAQIVATVERLDGVERALRSRVEALGGFMTDSEENERALTLSFRVPSAKLDAAITDVEAISKRVDSRQVKGEDVTAEFVDLSAQIANLEATRTQLRALAEKATNVDEALHVNKALSEVQGELEKVSGRAEFLRKSGELASVRVSFVPEAALSEWRPVEIARDSVQALLVFAQALASLAIVLAVFSPVWAPIALLVRRRARRLS